VVNFLTELFDDGAAFRTLALYRSAIASLHAYVGDIPVSLTQVVTDFFRAIRAERPPRPRYERLWHLEPVLRLLESWGPNADMPLPRLTKKLTFLLACANQNRASDSAAIAVSSVVIDRHGARFTVVAPKERSSRRYDRSDMVERIEDPARCVVRCMETYLSRTTGFRVGVPDRLLLTTVPPIHAATPQTIAKWNLACMAAAGIDTMEFKSHSIRAVATTTAVAAGAPAWQVAHGKWASVRTMNTFYNRAAPTPAQGQSPRAGVTARILRPPHRTTRSQEDAPEDGSLRSPQSGRSPTIGEG